MEVFMIKAIIFDLDGVIVSTDYLHYASWKEMADKENIYFDETINHRLRGVSRKDSLEIILEKSNRAYSADEKQKLMDYKNELYVKSLESLSKENILKNVEPALKEFKEMGLKLSIGSSSKNAKRILEYLNLNDYFDAISDGTNITQSKPDPEVFLKAAEYLEESPKNCLVVEDAHSGIDAAKAGGMLACAVSEAKSHKSADFRVDDLLELVVIVKEMQ
jgi:beta-phosphoglucomutase